MKMDFAIIAGWQAPGKQIAWLCFLAMTILAGCSVLQNSARFYQDVSVRPVNWREYTSD